MTNKYKKLILPIDTAWDKSRTSKASIYQKFKWWFYEKYLYTKIQTYFEKFFFDPIDNTINGITNLIAWFPTIWRDRNWDHNFIYTILEKKLLLQRRELVGANRHMGIDIVNERITTILNLIDKIKEDIYGMEYFNYQENGPLSFTPCEDNPELSTLDDNLISENWDEYLKKYPSTIRKVKRKFPEIDFTDKQRLVVFVSSHNEEKAKNLLFKLLSSHINSFWD